MTFKRRFVTDDQIVEQLTATPMRIIEASKHYHVGRDWMSKTLKRLAEEGRLKMKADMMGDGVNPDMRSKLFGVW